MPAKKGSTPWNKGKQISREPTNKHHYNDGKQNLLLTDEEALLLLVTKGWLPMSDEVKSKSVKKRKETCERLYGILDYNNSEKNKATCLEKYGSTTYIHSVLGEEVVRLTCLEKYGVDNPLKNSEIQKKSIVSTAINLGYSENEANSFSNVSQIKEIRDRVKLTCNSKYGSDSYLGSDECKDTTLKYYLNNYGKDCYSQTDDWKEKVQSTNIEKYGIPWYCMASECRDYSNDSKPNKLFAFLLLLNGIQFTREFPLKNYSYDFQIGNTLIEINPTITHNSTFGIFHKNPTDKNYHMNKSIVAEESGYRCIHIFDWDDQEKLISLLANNEVIPARKCDIREVSKEEAKDFITNNHVQGYINDIIRLGLYYNGELVSIMTFGKPRYNKNFEYELLRYCSSKNITGGAEKIFSHFISLYSPASIISYCDSSKFSGRVYEKLGFTLSNKRTPSKHWYNMKTKKHITNNLLLQRGFDQLFGTNFGKGTSNENLMREHGFVEVYDSGQLTYTYNILNSCVV